MSSRTSPMEESIMEFKSLASRPSRLSSASRTLPIKESIMKFKPLASRQPLLLSSSSITNEPVDAPSISTVPAESTSGTVKKAKLENMKIEAEPSSDQDSCSELLDEVQELLQERIQTEREIQFVQEFTRYSSDLQNFAAKLKFDLENILRMNMNRAREDPTP